MSEPARASARRAFALFAGEAYDPTTADGAVAWQRPNGPALLRRGATTGGLPGTHPALGGSRIAWRNDDRITIADARSLGRRTRIEAPGAGVLAVSDTAVAWRTRGADGTDRLWLSTGATPQLMLESPAPTEIGRPALTSGALLFHTAGPAGSALHAIDLATGVQQQLRAQLGAQLTNPASDGSRLLYVHATGEVQQLRLGPLGPADPAADRVLLVHASSGQRDRGHERGRRRHRAGYPGRRPPPLPPRASRGVVATLWTTALSADTAFVTRLRAIRPEQRATDILTVPAV